MIAREWKCRCPKHQTEPFLRYLRETGIAESSVLPGYRGAQVFVREVEQGSEVTLITFWESLESIEAFAGKAIGKAKLYPEDDKYEIVPDLVVRHYEVVEQHIGEVG